MLLTGVMVLGLPYVMVRPVSVRCARFLGCAEMPVRRVEERGSADARGYQGTAGQVCGHPKLDTERGYQVGVRRLLFYVCTSLIDGAPLEQDFCAFDWG